MSKLILAMFMTMDGFVENPAGEMVRPDWSDDLDRNWGWANIEGDFTLIYGRRAFEQNAGIWPAAETNENNSSAFRQLAGHMNRLPKVVMSSTLGSVGWNAEVRNEPVADTVNRLRNEGKRDIMAVGGVSLGAALIAEDLVDEYRLLIMPTLLGGGHSLFKQAHPPIGLKLRTAQTMDTGAILATYDRHRAGS